MKTIDQLKLRNIQNEIVDILDMNFIDEDAEFNLKRIWNELNDIIEGR